MIEILPGEITDPHWTGPRCGICARPVGGDGSMWRTCDDVPQVHASVDSIPAEKKTRFYTEKSWDNALRMLGILDAIDWMVSGRKGSRPVDLLRNGEGAKVLEKQFNEWPRLERELQAMRKFAA